MNDPTLALIAEDSRGKSWSLMLPNGMEIVLIWSKKGALRGGHHHNVPEVSIVLEGRIAYCKKHMDGKERSSVQTTGDVLRNAPGEAHLASFLEDSWIVDLRPGTLASERVNTNDPEYRALVEKQLQE